MYVHPLGNQELGFANPTGHTVERLRFDMIYQIFIGVEPKIKAVHRTTLEQRWNPGHMLDTKRVMTSCG
jgi:hypothetical protein